MNPQEALSLLDQVTARISLPRQETMAVLQALNVIKKALESKPEPEKKKAN